MNPEEFQKAVQENISDGTMEEVIIDGKKHIRLTHEGRLRTEEMLIERAGINPSDKETVEKWLRAILDE